MGFLRIRHVWMVLQGSQKETQAILGVLHLEKHPRWFTWSLRVLRPGRRRQVQHLHVPLRQHLHALRQWGLGGRDLRDVLPDLSVRQPAVDDPGHGGSARIVGSDRYIKGPKPEGEKIQTTGNARGKRVPPDLRHARVPWMHLHGHQHGKCSCSNKGYGYVSTRLTNRSDHSEYGKAERRINALKHRRITKSFNHLWLESGAPFSACVGQLCCCHHSNDRPK